MKLTFSDKYQPLFDLLDSWSMKDDDTLSKEQREYYNNLAKVDTVSVSGGRDSGKSYANKVFQPIAALKYSHTILSTRYTMSSTDQSITKALDESMDTLNLRQHFTEKGGSFYSNSNKGEIAITGQKNSSGNQTAKLKSLEDYSIFITEEAEELPSFEEWDKVKKSLRRKDVQCLAINFFNPPSVDHWMKKKLYDEKGVSIGFNGVKDNILYIHTTYLDNGRENMAGHNWNDYEAKRLDYELFLSTTDKDSLPYEVRANYKYYKHVCLGDWRMEVEHVIYENVEIGAFNNDLPYAFGLDFGSNDPDALVKVAVDQKSKTIYVDEQYFQNNTSAEGLANILADRCGYYTLIIADNNERRLITDLSDKGFNIRRASKTGNSSPVRRIRTIQGYKLIVTENSVNLQEALRRYCWHDKKSGVPKHDFSHLPNAMEYIVMDLIDN